MSLTALLEHVNDITPQRISCKRNSSSVRLRSGNADVPFSSSRKQVRPTEAGRPLQYPVLLSITFSPICLKAKVASVRGAGHFFKKRSNGTVAISAQSRTATNDIFMVRRTDQKPLNLYDWSQRFYPIHSSRCRNYGSSCSIPSSPMSSRLGQQRRDMGASVRQQKSAKVPENQRHVDADSLKQADE